MTPRYIPWQPLKWFFYGLVSHLCHAVTTIKPKKEKFARVIFKSASLGRSLDAIKKHYDSVQERDSLVIPYILTCAAYLESKLNDSLSHFAAKRFGDDISDALMSLSLPKKLNVLVPIMTEGAYQVNKQHFVYQRLASLIRVRNTIAHAKSEIEEIEVHPEDLVEIPVIFDAPAKVPRQFMEPPDITLGAAKSFTPDEYYDALKKLERWFFQRCPDRLGKIAMVERRPEDSGWKEVVTTMRKEL